MESKNGFSSKIGYVLAAAGSAVGLGNIWGFPYAEAIGATMAAVTTFLGAILGISSLNYQKKIGGGDNGKN